MGKYAPAKADKRKPTASNITKRRGVKATQRIAITPLMQAAAVELLKRRRATTGLLAFTKYTFPRFQASWHHEVVCKALERVDGTVDEPAIVRINGIDVDLHLPKHIDRLMVFAPPRHTKSELISIRRPAWSLGRDRTRMFINVTYGSDLAHTFSRACLATLNSDPFRLLFPNCVYQRGGAERWKVKRSVEEENNRDSMIASGILSPLTGEGATDINVDDPFKNKSEAYSKLIRDRVHDEYTTSIRTRLQPGGTIALMLTRWHKDDLAGRLLDIAMRRKDADQWTVLVLPAMNDDGQSAYVLNTATDTRTFLPKYEALWPEWFNRANLDKTKAGTSNAFWMAMYQQSPTSATGGIFLADKWSEFIDEHPILERCIHVWDTAMEDSEENDNDFSAFCEMGIDRGRYLVTDAYRERLAFPDLVAAIYKKWDGAIKAGKPVEVVCIEQKGSGISLLQTIQSNNVDPNWAGSRIPVIGMPATLNKTVRALSVSGYQNSGLVALPVGEFPSATDDGGKAEFIDEHSDFPKGQHDDWVDTVVHGLTYYTRPIPGTEHEETIVDELDHLSLNNILDRADFGEGW